MSILKKFFWKLIFLALKPLATSKESLNGEEILIGELEYCWYIYLFSFRKFAYFFFCRFKKSTIILHLILHKYNCQLKGPVVLGATWRSYFLLWAWYLFLGKRSLILRWRNHDLQFPPVNCSPPPPKKNKKNEWSPFPKISKWISNFLHMQMVFIFSKRIF